MTGTIIYWGAGHGRNDALSSELGCERFNAGHENLNPRTAVQRYFRAGSKTARYLRERHPNYVILTLPPLPAALATVPVARSLGIPVYFDCHTGVFNDPKWKWALPLTLAVARRCAGMIVTNRELSQLVNASGVACWELDDPPEQYTTDAVEEVALEPYVFVPSSFSSDEPTDTILKAAGRMPGTRFMVSGCPPSRIVSRSPTNVTFTGWLSAEEYRKAILRTSAVLCLTTRPSTMQRGGYEALAAGVPLITSDFTVLREYFGDAAVFVDPQDTADVAQGIVQCLHERSDYRQRIVHRREFITRRYTQQLAAIREAIDEGRLHRQDPC